MNKNNSKFSFYAAVVLVVISFLGIIYSYQNSVIQKEKLMEVKNSKLVPTAVLDRQKFDWGEIQRGLIAEESFVLSNEGEGPLKINKIVTSCGCTTAELLISDKVVDLPAVINQGAQGIVQVKFDPDAHDSRGEVKRAVRIETNDPEHPFLVINLLAHVK